MLTRQAEKQKACLATSLVPVGFSIRNHLKTTAKKACLSFSDPLHPMSLFTNSFVCTCISRDTTGGFSPGRVPNPFSTFVGLRSLGIAFQGAVVLYPGLVERPLPGYHSLQPDGKR